MTETRDNRFGVPNWSSGTDSGSRTDFNEGYTALATKAARDDGVTHATLPITDIPAGRYVMVVPDLVGSPGTPGPYRTLYRRHDGTDWDAVGGNTMPVPFHYRALDGQARTDAAITFSHPDFEEDGGTIGYDGSALLSGTVRVYDADEAGRGALLIGTDAAPNLATLGRAYVRTRADAERALVVQAGHATSGSLFTARTLGGSDTLTIDALGQLRAQAAAAFGGAGMPTTSAVAISPTSSTEDSVTNGLALVGLTGNSTVEAKALLRAFRDSSESTAPLVSIERDALSWGKQPWSSDLAKGQSVYGANGHTFRAYGHTDNTFYWRLRRTDPTSLATQANTALDTTLLNVTKTTFISNLPVIASNRLSTAATTLALQRITDFSAGFISLHRLVPDGGGGETTQLASAWDSDGRLRTGAWWKSTGTVRDARQSATHVSTKRYTTYGAAFNTGQYVVREQYVEYEWDTMTMRSSGATDLDIQTIAECIVLQNNDGIDDAQQIYVETYIKINAGSYVFLAGSETPMNTPSTVHRPGGGVLVASHRLASADVVGGLSGGDTIRLKTRFRVGSATPDARLRMLDIKVTECLIEIYETE